MLVYLLQSGGRQQLLVPSWQMQSLEQSQHSRRQLVNDVISHHDSNSWLPRTSLLDQLQSAAAAAATRALVNRVVFLNLCPWWALALVLGKPGLPEVLPSQIEHISPFFPVFDAFVTKVVKRLSVN